MNKIQREKKWRNAMQNTDLPSLSREGNLGGMAISADGTEDKTPDKFDRAGVQRGSNSRNSFRGLVIEGLADARVLPSRSGERAITPTTVVEGSAHPPIFPCPVEDLTLGPPGPSPTVEASTPEGNNGRNVADTWQGLRQGVRRIKC